jgi:O-antigen ligase
MVRIVEIGLISAAVLDVLAFGGTDPLFFSVVQIVLFGLGILVLVTHGTPRIGKPSFTVAIPLLLAALVLLQIAPLPASVVQLFHHTGNQLSGASFASISIAPYETLSHLIILLTYMAAFYLTLVICQRPNSCRHLIFALLALGTFEACYGLLQYLTRWQQIFTYVKKYDLEEATGTYINRNHYAGLLEMILPFALALAFYQFGKIPKTLAGTEDRMRSFFSHEEFQKFLLCLFLAIVLFVGLVFSRSRMGIVSAVVSTLLLFTLIATSGRRRVNAALLAIVFLSAGIWMVVWIGPEPVIARFGALGQEYPGSGQSRWGIWQDTLQLIRQHPWLGSGLGTFAIAYPSVQTALLSWFVDHAHNDYLQLASEVGLPMALLFFGAVFSLLARSNRRFRMGESRFDRAIALGCFGAIVAILLHSLTDFNLYIRANALVFAVVLGLAYANSPKEMRSGAPVPNSSV